MKVQLYNNYGGDRTREQRIAPGIYDIDDPALHGLADYLVENGHAVYISEQVIAKADAQRASVTVSFEAPENPVDIPDGSIIVVDESVEEPNPAPKSRKSKS